LSLIEDASTKIEKREAEGRKIDKKKKVMVDKTTLDNINKIGLSSAARSRLVTTTDKVKTVKRTKPSNSTKYIKKAPKV
jgi:hypothetical protein